MHGLVWMDGCYFYSCVYVCMGNCVHVCMYGSLFACVYFCMCVWVTVFVCVFVNLYGVRWLCMVCFYVYGWYARVILCMGDYVCMWCLLESAAVCVVINSISKLYT